MAKRIHLIKTFVFAWWIGWILNDFLNCDQSFNAYFNIMPHALNDRFLPTKDISVVTIWLHFHVSAR